MYWTILASKDPILLTLLTKYPYQKYSYTFHYRCCYFTCLWNSFNTNISPVKWRSVICLHIHVCKFPMLVRVLESKSEANKANLIKMRSAAVRICRYVLSHMFFIQFWSNLIFLLLLFTVRCECNCNDQINFWCQLLSFRQDTSSQFFVM